MPRLSLRSTIFAAAIFSMSSVAVAQNAGPATINAATSPTTKLEAFAAAAGTVTTFGFTELGSVGSVAIDVREMRAVGKTPVRGFAVEVTEGFEKSDLAFIDEDEVPALLKGIDALLAVKSNPTTFANFEVSYVTKGKLELTAFNAGGTAANPQLRYLVRAGKETTTTAVLSETNMLKLKELIVEGMRVMGGK
jgi:hypothetical protein